jgi:hypothetical protein
MPSADVVPRLISDRLYSIYRCRVKNKRGTIRPAVKYWEIIADNLKQAGWSLGFVSAIDFSGANDLDC